MQFGAVTEDGKIAARELCSDGNVTMKSTVPIEHGKPVFPGAGSNIAIQHCDRGDGWLAYQPDTNQLVSLTIIAERKNIVRLLDRVLLPAFNDEQRRGYLEMRDFLEHSSEPGAMWSKGGTLIKASHWTKAAKPGDEPEWFIAVRYADE